MTLTDGSQIEASTLGAEAGGTLAVSASESVEVIGSSADGQHPSGLATQVYPGATGAGGNLTLETGRLLVRDGAQVGTRTLGIGDGGTLSVTAADRVELLGTSAADCEFFSGLYSLVQSGAEGDAGDLTIATRRLVVRDGAKVLASTFGIGDGGTLSVTASDAVEVIGTSVDGQSFSGLSTQTEGDGHAGDLTIATRRLVVRDGAEVFASTFGTGDGGTLSVTASDDVEVIGTSADGEFISGLLAATGGDGDAGDLTLWKSWGKGQPTSN